MLIALLAFTSLLASAEPVTISRYALIIGANRGSLQDVPLQFADRDAERMAAALQQVGSFAPANVRLLEQPTPTAVRLALESLHDQLVVDQARHNPSVLLLYFAGHADPSRMHLGRASMAWAELLQRSLGATARILVVDASRAETVAEARDTPLMQPGFQGLGLDHGRTTMTTPSADLTVLTAMSADYAARESAAAGSGILTRHILAALAGAADANGDDHVTLSETILYGAERTLRRVERSPLGDPRGVFRFHLGSAGELPLATLPSRQQQPRLHLTSPGTYTVRSGSADGPVLLEAVVVGGERSLCLPVGTYFVEHSENGQRHGGAVTLAAASIIRLDGEIFPIAGRAIFAEAGGS